MEMPTAHELDTDPAGSLRRLRGIRADMDAAEMTAIAAWMRRGGNLSGLAVRVGVSRQALNQRMQRKLKTREPAVTLRKNAIADLAVQARRQRDEIEEILQERDRQRAAAEAAATVRVERWRAVAEGCGHDRARCPDR